MCQPPNSILGNSLVLVRQRTNSPRRVFHVARFRTLTANAEHRTSNTESRISASRSDRFARGVSRAREATASPTTFDVGRSAFAKPTADKSTFASLCPLLFAWRFALRSYRLALCRCCTFCLHLAKVCTIVSPAILQSRGFSLTRNPESRTRKLE